MKTLSLIIPIALMVAYSQLIVKWRTSMVDFSSDQNLTIIKRLLSYIQDPFILSGYVMALLSSFLWLIVIAKIPLSIGFPIYIGCTFMLVIIGSLLWLKEPFSIYKLVAATLIFLGIVIGVVK